MPDPDFLSVRVRIAGVTSFNVKCHYNKALRDVFVSTSNPRDSPPLGPVAEEEENNSLKKPFDNRARVTRTQKQFLTEH